VRDELVAAGYGVCECGRVWDTAEDINLETASCHGCDDNGFWADESLANLFYSDVATLEALIEVGG
jgi:hypothetical protein